MGLGCFLSSVREIACVSRVFFFSLFQNCGIGWFISHGWEGDDFFSSSPITRNWEVTTDTFDCHKKKL